MVFPQGVPLPSLLALISDTLDSISPSPHFPYSICVDKCKFMLHVYAVEANLRYCSSDAINHVYGHTSLLLAWN